MKMLRFAAAVLSLGAAAACSNPVSTDEEARPATSGPSLETTGAIAVSGG